MIPRELEEIPLWIFLRMLITFQSSNIIFFTILKWRVQVKVKVKVFGVEKSLWSSTLRKLKQCCPQRALKHLLNDTKISLLACIEAEIRPILGTRSGRKGQSSPTRISESIRPKNQKIGILHISHTSLSLESFRKIWGGHVNGIGWFEMESLYSPTRWPVVRCCDHIVMKLICWVVFKIV